ncbi:unnamed protein product [marine sediment metagenome]|uniref:Uncharacterized protein n=1 Tax=marine sediment metagenome TaxID=412755 RepID=X1T4D3_9ZZZZ
MEQGIEVERRAREVYPKGLLITEVDIGKALETTKEIISEKNTPVIFAPVFHVDDYTTRADILKLKYDYRPRFRDNS